jgi:hypothetical protein
MAVVVKKVSMIMRLMELEFLLQYFASATNALQISKVHKPQVRNYCWFNLFACQIRSRSIPTRKWRSCEIVKSLALHHVHIALLAPLTIYFKQTKNKVALSFLCEQTSGQWAANFDPE